MHGGVETGLVPLAGGHSGETFLAEFGGDRSVVRILRPGRRPPGSARRDAAVLRWVRGLVPVPDVLEVRDADTSRDVPELLVTAYVDGVRGDEYLAGATPEDATAVGDDLAQVLVRLAGIATPGPGLLDGPDLALVPLPASSVEEWVERLEGDEEWRTLRSALAPVVEEADAVLARTMRSCLVHGDLNLKNLLVDPDRRRVAAVVDWEHARSDTPYADLGNLLRFDDPGLDVVRGRVLPAYAECFEEDLLDLPARAAAADLVALTELAAREVAGPGAVLVRRARALLRARVRHGLAVREAVARF
ncbi:phosphotransferase family protein [Nocardioides sp.]|uniref:phosphotransferase family protein n=1 Tax=Nocardioides sp. TaxID=35761 RepID=UPI0027353A20|nr:phosphotransferase [Nocardioides sp.]MDP3890142.1 phosphotransferase [Nocardioides sp.]